MQQHNRAASAPMICQHCGWFGRVGQSTCPECSATLQAINQQQITDLAQQYRALSQGESDLPQDERAALIARIEQTLDMQGESTGKAFQRMALSGRMNALMNEGVQASLANGQHG